MAINVKELKDDAIVEIKVNKGYYLMTKALSYFLFQTITDDKEREESLKKGLRERSERKPFFI